MGIENNIVNYSILLRQVKQRVALAQQRAIFAANEELLHMYWDLGHILYKTQHAEGWGKGTLARLSADMKNEYPEEKGFSVRNFQCMIQFYEEYNQELTMVKSIAQPSVAQLNGIAPSVQITQKGRFLLCNSRLRLAVTLLLMMVLGATQVNILV